MDKEKCASVKKSYQTHDQTHEVSNQEEQLEEVEAIARKSLLWKNWKLRAKISKGDAANTTKYKSTPHLSNSQCLEDTNVTMIRTGQSE